MHCCRCVEGGSYCRLLLLAAVRGIDGMLPAAAGACFVAFGRMQASGMKELPVGTDTGVAQSQNSRFMNVAIMGCEDQQLRCSHTVGRLLQLTLFLSKWLLNKKFLYMIRNTFNPLSFSPSSRERDVGCKHSLIQCHSLKSPSVVLHSV